MEGRLLLASGEQGVEVEEEEGDRWARLALTIFHSEKKTPKKLEITRKCQDLDKRVKQ